MTAIVLPHNANLLPLRKEKRNRRNMAYLIHDAKSATLLLTQKLPLAVEYINSRLAEAEREKVSVPSLYEAADTQNNRINGFHKMRYLIRRCDYSKAHQLFAEARDAAVSSVLLTAESDCYPLSLR